jgi:hypothetical protein
MAEKTPLSDKAIEQRGKTLRLSIIVGALVLIATLGILLKRNVGVDFKEMKVSVSGPESIVQQTHQTTQQSNINVPFTVKTVDYKTSQAILEQKDKINQTGFTGKNYINYDHGFLFAVDNPEKWSSKLSYNSGAWNQIESMGLQGNALVNIVDPMGNYVLRMSGVDNISGESMDESVQGFITMFALTSGGIVPTVNRAKEGSTEIAFFDAANSSTGISLLCKLIHYNNKMYMGMLYYSTAMGGNSDIQELKQMLASLTVMER